MRQKRNRKTLLKLGVGFLICIFVLGGMYLYLKKPNAKTFNNFAVNSKDSLQKENHSKASERQKAISIVKSLPEVQKWLGLYTNADGTSPKTGGKPVIEFESMEGEIYLIHVYEQMSDHRATFNWYDVNVKTGKVKDFFGKEY